ncbi:hypothetical protein L3X38_034220 [Prunus dulcis]|uniref:Uncharacterized protein n=1 Tax=Prunus dulcis TaxID=3755 RepID=A0AAD4YXI6_PRUDU|nr:hypothetical protein L3X38_034220 [Prunus dulcis]
MTSAPKRGLELGPTLPSGQPREKDIVADRLASWSHNLDMDLYMLDEATDWLGFVSVDDLLGLSKPRMIYVV